MTSHARLFKMLASQHAHPKHVLLLKKIMLTVALGRLRIHGEPPDDSVSLADYFLDEENVILDCTRLSEDVRPQLDRWLLEVHQDTRELNYFNKVATTDYRGFTAEVSLSLWGQIKRWFFGKPTNYWPLATMAVNLEPQLLGIDIQEGMHGLLVGLHQKNIPISGYKYSHPREHQYHPMGNTKRVYLTDKLVYQLVHTDLNTVDLDTMYKNPHLQSISVENHDKRFNEMETYRKIQQFADKPWYASALDWVMSWFVKPKTVDNGPSIQLQKIMEEQGVSIFASQTTNEIIVREPRPDLDSLVLCGGGIKLFTHVGVLKAFKEADIQFKKFAGSSAGGIIDLLAYIGYTPDEILFFLNQIRSHHLVHYEVDKKGLSSTSGLKAALDYMVAKKVDEIVTAYKIPHPEGIISFLTLENLREQCPLCGIGENLVVTATNKRRGTTTYLSLKHTPHMEVTKAIVASASFPVLYKPMDIEGEDHNDGGILNNFPTDVFKDDNSALLEAENGSYLKLFAVQFDNGTERNAIDSILERVHRESTIINWLYQFLTGVNDPASGWEQDRIKLRQHALQSIVVSVGNIGSTQFDVSEKEKNELVKSGYEAAKAYINTRYKDGENDEMMQTRFTCLSDFLSYCCYRNNEFWFKKVKQYIGHSQLKDKEALLEKAHILQQQYFPNVERHAKTITFFNTALDSMNNTPSFRREPSLNVNTRKSDYDVFLLVYPLIFQLSQQYLQDKKARQLFEKARHSINLHTSLDSFIDSFSKIDGKMHILFHVVQVLLQTYLYEEDENKRFIFQEITNFLQQDTNLNQPYFYGQWKCSTKQCLDIFALFKSNSVLELKNWCENMQTIKAVPIKDMQEQCGSSLEI